MRRVLMTVLLLVSLSACGTVVKGDHQERMEQLVRQTPEAAYIRAQQTAVAMTLRVTDHQDVAHIFTAMRASGEELVVVVKPMPVGSLLSVTGRPPHDVRDFFTAYASQ